MSYIKYLSVILILPFFFSCASIPAKWSFRDKALGGIAITGSIADTAITERMLDTGRYRETNLFLEDHPSDGALGLHTAIEIIGVMLLAHYAPEKYRPYILGSWAVIHWGCTYHNYRLWKKE